MVICLFPVFFCFLLNEFWYLQARKKSFDLKENFAIIKRSLCPKGGLGVRMSSVIVKENESLDSALRRFKRNCAKAGIQQEIRKREHYEKPSVRRKKKSEAARKRKFN